MKLEFELKSTDILLLKVLSCILIAVLTLNLFIFPGLNKQADLSAQKEETRQEKQQVEEAIASMPATKARIEQQQSDLTELSEDYYPQMENNNVDELVTGIALAHGLFPAALNIEDSVPGRTGSLWCYGRYQGYNICIGSGSDAGRGRRSE